MSAGNKKEAETYFYESIDIDKDFEPNYIQLGRLLSSYGDFKNANILYDKAIKINPNSKAVELKKQLKKIGFN